MSASKFWTETMIELPGVREDGMLGRNGQRKPGTTRGPPRRSRTAKALRISRHAVKSRCARGWGGWGRLSDDGSGQHNSGQRIRPSDREAARTARGSQADEGLRRWHLLVRRPMVARWPREGHRKNDGLKVSASPRPGGSTTRRPRAKLGRTLISALRPRIPIKTFFWRFMPSEAPAGPLPKSKILFDPPVGGGGGERTLQTCNILNIREPRYRRPLRRRLSARAPQRPSMVCASARTSFAHC
jgi:hypothetical protein